MGAFERPLVQQDVRPYPRNRSHFCAHTLASALYTHINRTQTQPVRACLLQPSSKVSCAHLPVRALGFLAVYIVCPRHSVQMLLCIEWPSRPFVCNNCCVCCAHVVCTRSRVEMAGVTMHALISCTRTMRVLLHPALSTLQLRVENVRVLAKRHV